MVRIETGSEAETRRVGGLVAELLVERGGVVALEGELGAGKTVFVKGMAEALGIGADEVTSPTFVLAVRHEGSAVLWHLDAYRLDKAQFESSCGEVFEEGGIVVVEWAEKVRGALPDGAVWVRIEHAGYSRRRIFVEADAEFEERLRQRLAR